jgi:hypothetical protein
MSQLDLEVTDQVARYLAGESSLDEFRRWLLPLVWKMAEPTSNERSDLANRLELRLAEFMNGHWTEDDLRLLFARLLPPTSSLVTDLELQVRGARATSPVEPIHARTEFIPTLS